MIEFLTARRMIFVIGVLILLCIIIVILEDTITDHVADKPSPYLDVTNHHYQQHNFSIYPSISNDAKHLRPNISHSNYSIKVKGTKQSASLTPHHIKPPSSSSLQHCWEREKFRIETRCALCTAKERVLLSDACAATGFRERLRCEITGIAFRQCDSASGLFWTFQFFAISICLVFNFYVKRRQSFLNRSVLERIEKQIASGV